MIANEVEFEEHFQDAGVSMYKVDVAPGRTLVIPPGYLISNCSISKEASSGVKMLFVPKGEMHRQRFHQIYGMLGDDRPAQTSVSAMLDHLSLEQQS